MKIYYLVMVLEVPHVLVPMISDKPVKPILMDGSVGYCPVYSNRLKAMKDHPGKEIVEIEIW